MGTVGDCYDNAPMESFWGSMQIELLNRQRWRTNLELAVAIADYIEHFYNPARRHSSLGYLTPERVRRSTFTQTRGHVVISRGPPNGLKACEVAAAAVPTSEDTNRDILVAGPVIRLT